MLAPIGTGTASAATTLINDTFANSTSSSNVDVASNSATGVEGQSFPCLTAAAISQGSPTSNTTTVASSATFTDQIATTGNSGPVTFATTTSSPDVVVSSSGSVSTTGPLPVGTYPVSGTDTGGTGTGVWSYTLDVASSSSSIIQSAPSANTTTTGSSATFTDQLATTGNSGPVTFATTTSSPDVAVSSSGAVSTTGPLPVGTYPVSGTDTDGTGTGVWSYTLHVTASTSTIQNCHATAPDSDGSGALMLTDGGFGEASNVIYGGSFPTVDGLDITFDAHMYGGTPLGPSYADGISFDLAAAPPNPGAVGSAGGALGYSTDGSTPGMPAGYLGVGLDEYGNYSTTTYEGNDCHTSDPTWAGYFPNEVTVHGPGNGTSGYCLLASSLQDGPDPLGPSGIQLHGADFASSEITVHIVIDTSVPNSPTYTVTLQPVGDSSATTITSGPLPDFYYDPVTGQQVTGIPSQLTFAVAASTGSGSDVHEIDNLSTTTQSGNPLTTLDLGASDDHSGSVGLGESFNYVLTPKVDPGSAVSEDDPVTLVDHLPVNQVLTGTPSGTGWDCSATSTTTNTADCTYTPTAPIAAGDTLPPVSVPAATTSGSPGSTVTDTASVSSPDSVSYASATDTVTLTAPNPLLDASISDSDAGSVPLSSPAFDLTLGASVDVNGPAESAPPVVNSTLPSQLELASTPSGTDWDCAASVGQTVSCTYTGAVPIANGTSLPAVTVPVQLAPTDQVGNQFTVSDTVTSADSAPFYAASTATETITVSSAAAGVVLGLTETDSGTPPGTVDGGTPFTYTLSVSVGAGGLPESLPITLTETTPTGVGLQAVPTTTDPNWNCSATNVGTDTVDCVYTPTSAVAPGTALEPIVVPTFMSDTTFGDQITDSSATASSADSTAVHATDTVTVAQAPVGLTLGVSDTIGGSAPTGTAFNYLLNATVASGQAESDTITVTDPLPSGTELTALPSGTGWDCSASVLNQTFMAYYVDCTYTPPIGGVSPVTALPTIVAPAMVTDATVGATLVNTAQAGSDDAARVTALDTITVSQAPQAITFTSSPPTATVGGTYTPTATGGASGNPVVFTIAAASASVCSITGGVVGFIGVGTCTVDANQAGNTNYAAAPQQQQGFPVGQASQAITFASTPPALATVGGATYTPAATGGASGNPVVFTIAAASASVCSVSGGVVSFTGPGTCTVDANQAGNTNYAAAPQVAQNVPVSNASASCTIVWTGGTGDWTTTADWTPKTGPARLPNSADTTCIPAPGDVTLSSTDPAENSGTLLLGNADGSGSATLQVNGTLTMQAGTVYPGGVLSLGSTGAVSSLGTVANAGSITLAPSATFTDEGTVDNDSGGSITNGGTFTTGF
ncbi:MAG TPA: hypothetical protein VN796_12790, partial [Acidimicrobiales bacterium]|nr:hypothetical protein [Acidimicrobiales bacterium]